MNNHTESGKGTATPALRPEARPAIYKTLDKQQQDAFGRIVKLIAEAIDGIDAARESRSVDTIATSTQLPPWLDEHSATRMAFLHGHRGMGKTTVMLSVLRACKYWDDTEYAELDSAIRKMRARTVWLEPIALEPLPGSANLLGALLARIDRAVQVRLSPSGVGARDATGRVRGGALALMSDQEQALVQLQRLQTAVAVAWDGNLPARGGQLDPDTYAVELLRAERSRLSLKHELSVSLNALADAFYPVGTLVSNPLFVLPVDDVDLDPLRCLEILKFLRLVPVPRLFAIVLGNLRIVDLVLNLQYSNDFASAYRGRFLETLSVDGQEVAGWAGQAAANALEKLIPLAQRIVLEHMSVSESLNFRPLSAGAEEPRFHRLLALLPLQLTAGYARRYDLQNLRQFLLYTDDYQEVTEDKELNDKDLENSHCSSINLLRAPPRRITDWWFDLQRLLHRVKVIIRADPADPPSDETHKKVHKEIVLALGRVCYWLINEDHMLPTDIRWKYRQALRINPAGIWELVAPVDSIPDIDKTYTLSSLRSSTGEPPWDSMEPSPRIFIHHCRGWYLRPAEALSPIRIIVDLEKDPGYLYAGTMPRFNEDTTYALMLLHDLLGLGPEAVVMKQTMQIDQPYERWAGTVWPPGTWISWPAPFFGSYWETDLFVRYWNKVVDIVEACERVTRKNSVEGTLEPLVFGWIDAARAVWTGEKPINLLDQKDPTKIVASLPWPDLAQKVAGLISTADNEVNKRTHKNTKLSNENTKLSIEGVKEWLARLPYLLSPAVSGLGPGVVKQFLKEEHLRGEWQRSADLIKSYDKRIRDSFVGKGMDTVVERLNPYLDKHLGLVSGSMRGGSKQTRRRPASKDRGQSSS